ncbi:STAS/SEC14 domain-containing protein [Shewanella sp. GXUN23E]|uniref:STAS/SEC14 domain-containing protein n=1 Tax=Shewanella sp. GXUN23E TaxID=3422498 RepID=UPI003D7EFDE5
MNITRHGISIGIERIGDDDFFLTLKAVGKLTHDDYQKMVPMLEAAIAGVDDPDIYALCDVTELEGWEARAMWDDLKLGLKHGKHFEKIAIVGNSTKQEWLTRLADWFTPADVKFFVTQFDAIVWLKD